MIWSSKVYPIDAKEEDIIKEEFTLPLNEKQVKKFMTDDIAEANKAKGYHHKINIKYDVEPK